jgi:hypothetical protein
VKSTFASSVLLEMVRMLITKWATTMNATTTNNLLIFFPGSGVNRGDYTHGEKTSEKEIEERL